MLALVAAAMAAPAARADAPAVFDLSVRGLPAAVLRFTGTTKGDRYSIAGRLESSALAVLVRPFRYEARAEGAVSGKRFSPRRYRETTNRGDGPTEAVMDYRRGVPQVKVYDPPRPAEAGTLDPATQGGTVDPLTAMFAALRDMPADGACDLALTLFDGKRRSQVVLGPPAPVDGGLACDGEYRRLEGFSSEDMAERTRFAFRLTLRPTPEGTMQVTEVRMDTIFGPAVMARR